jgi:hypothetical protein
MSNTTDPSDGVDITLSLQYLKKVMGVAQLAAAQRVQGGPTEQDTGTSYTREQLCYHAIWNWST